MFKISTSECGTVRMHRRFRACTDEFLAMVTEDVVHRVYKVVTRFFGVIWQRKASGVHGLVTTLTQGRIQNCNGS